MSDFAELFNNVSASAMSELVNSSVVLSSLRDSKIKLVTELDNEHPLKAGEYYFSEDENTLYVGAGVIDSITFGITDFIQHHTSIRVIEAPRISSLVDVVIPNISVSASAKHVPAYRIKCVDNVVPDLSIAFNSNVRVTNKNIITRNISVDVPSITIESEVI